MRNAILYSLLLTLAAWSADGAEVRLKPEAECAGGIVRLKDIADILSEDEQEADGLAELPLFPVPSAGKVRTCRRGEVRELLALSDVNMQAISLTGAENVVIRKSKPAASFLPESNYPARPTSLITPTTKLPAKFAESAGVQLIPTVIRPVEKGAILRASDIELRPATVRQAAGMTSATIESLVGKEAIRAMSPGQIITREQVQSPRLVQRNDKVTVTSVAAGVVVAVSGKALEEGGLGDNVLVEDASTREKLVTRVTGFQTVEVLGTSAQSIHPRKGP